MSAKLIGVIYLYAVSLISLLIIVGGIFSSIKTGLNLTLYDKYPSRLGPPVNVCNFTPPIPKMVSSDTAISTPSAEEMKKWKQECESNTAIQAKAQKVEDITRSLVMLLVGGVLFAYHYPKAKNSS